MNAASDFQNLWRQLGTSSRTTASPWLSSKAPEITRCTICNSAEQENICIIPFSKTSLKRSLLCFESSKFPFICSNHENNPVQNQSQLTRTNTEDEIFSFFSPHIEEIKKKEVSKAERTRESERERSQTASSAWGAAILEACREQRWDCNAVKGVYIQHSHAHALFSRTFLPKWGGNKRKKTNDLTKGKGKTCCINILKSSTFPTVFTPSCVWPALRLELLFLAAVLTNQTFWKMTLVEISQEFARIAPCTGQHGVVGPAGQQYGVSGQMWGSSDQLGRSRSTACKSRSY